LEIELPLTDKAFSSDKNSEELNYMAILSRDSLFYGILNENEEILLSESLDIHQISRSKKIEMPGFFKIAVAFNNPIFSLVSALDYDANTLDSYLSFSNHLKNTAQYEFRSSFIEKYSIWLIYAVPIRILKSLRKYLGDFDVMHFQECFLAIMESSEKFKIINASLVGNKLSVAFVDQGKLILSNTYSVYNESELFYFISLIFDQYDMRSGDAKIYLQGDFLKTNIDINRFSQLFGTDPIYTNTIDQSNSNETSIVNMPLIQLNKCASFQGH